MQVNTHQQFTTMSHLIHPQQTSPLQSTAQPHYCPLFHQEIYQPPPTVPSLAGNQVVMQQSPLSMKKAPYFNGNTCWSDYLVQFELVANLNGWTDDVKALELATSLRDAAQGILADLDVTQLRNYPALAAALTNRFEPPNCAEMFRAELKCRSRSPGERLCDLVQDIKRLVRNAYPDDPKQTRAKLAKDSFVDALNDADMEWSIFQRKPNTVDEALQYAVEYESFQKGRNLRMGSRRGLRMQSMENPQETAPDLRYPPNPPQLSSYSSQPLQMIQQQHQFVPAGYKQQWQSADTIVCWFCNTPGHVKKECRKYAAWVQVHGQGNYSQLPL